MFSDDNHTPAESICPECLKLIPAIKITEGEQVYLQKKCSEHGEFCVKIWHGKPVYKEWNKIRIPSAPVSCAAEAVKGCPFDCGLCPDHRQQTCCVLFELTDCCNLQCPVCFAGAGTSVSNDPDIDEIRNWYSMLLDKGGPFNIQLSGGEPTIRNDLPEIIRLGINMGFTFIQLNTNGIRLAEETGYAEKLHDAGLSCVFLQFDGMDDVIHRALRGADLMKIKLKAIETCAKSGLGIVLVPTLVPGVNTENIGNIIKFALDNMPHVRGVHFQPISYFGRFPGSDMPRITIPEIIQKIESQTGGVMESSHFIPPGGENSHCSFHGNFIKMPDGKLKPWADKASQGCCSKAAITTEGSKMARQFVARQWSAPSCCGTENILKASKTDNHGINTDSIDLFLSRVKTHSICISGMAFQDAWTLELERLRECIIHVVSRDGKLIPFCAYNLTSRNGKSLYRGN